MSLDLIWDKGKPKKSRTEDDLHSKAKQKEEKVNRIAEEILFYLVAESRANLYPKRVNPGKLKLITEEEIAKFEKVKEDKSHLELRNSLAEQKIIEEAKDAPLEDSPQSRMAIKTDSNTVLEYMKVLFDKIKGSEDEFIMNLSTPLQRNALEILMHLQNTHYELESYEMLPYQQSVLTVDLYLEIERSRKRTEEQLLAIERVKVREEHERQKLIEKEKKQKNDQDKKNNLQVQSNNESKEIKQKLSSQLAEGTENEVFILYNFIVKLI